MLPSDRVHQFRYSSVTCVQLAGRSDGRCLKGEIIQSVDRDRKVFRPRNPAALVGDVLEGIEEDIERIPETKRSKEGVSNIEGRSSGDHVIDHQDSLVGRKWLIYASRRVAVVVGNGGIAVVVPAE